MNATPTSSPLFLRVLVALCALASLGAAQSHLGKEFWVAQPATPAPGFFIVITNPGTSVANVTLYNVIEGTTNGTVAPGGVSTYAFPDHCYFATGQSMGTDPVYHITSDREVGVILFDPQGPTNTNDATLALPIQTLGTEHRIGSFASWPTLILRPYVIAVAASPGTTNVQLIDATETVALSVNLTQGQCVQRLDWPDMTGWKLVADKPVAVFSGNECDEIGGACCCDLMYEQLLPETKHSDRYVVAPFLTRPIGCTSSATCSPDVFRFTATQDGTVLTTTPNVGGGTLNEGDFLEFDTTLPFVIQGNHPFLAYQYMIGFFSVYGSSPPPNAGDPDMVDIVPVPEYRQDYLVWVDSYANNFLNVIAPAGTALLVDNTPITPTWSPVGTLDSVNYECTRVLVSPGTHRVSSPNERFALTVSGVDLYSSYSYVAGLGEDCMPGAGGWIRDTDDDDGGEPDPSTNAMWDSPDIWVRHQQDTSLQFAHQHQNALPNTQNYVYVELRNKGCDTLVGGQVVTYFSKVSTGQAWSASWIGNPLTGDVIGSQSITPIAVGGSLVLEFPWTPPASGALGILARFVSTSDPMTFAEVTSVLANTKNNNNIAWKNVTVITPPEVTVAGSPLTAFPVTLHNLADFGTELQLELGTADGPLDSSFVAQGTVRLTLPPELFAAWELAGGTSVGLQHLAGTSVFEMTEPFAALTGLPFAADEEQTVVLHFVQTREQRMRRRPCDPLELRQRAAGAADPDGGMSFHFSLPDPRRATR